MLSETFIFSCQLNDWFKAKCIFVMLPKSLDMHNLSSSYSLIFTATFLRIYLLSYVLYNQSLYFFNMTK